MGHEPRRADEPWTDVPRSRDERIGALLRTEGALVYQEPSTLVVDENKEFGDRARLPPNDPYRMKPIDTGKFTTVVLN